MQLVHLLSVNNNLVPLHLWLRKTLLNVKKCTYILSEIISAKYYESKYQSPIGKPEMIGLKQELYKDFMEFYKDIKVLIK